MSIEAKLRKDEAELQEWRKVEHEARKGGKQMPAEPTYTCPACSACCATTTPTARSSSSRRRRSSHPRQSPANSPNTSAHATCWRDQSRTTSATSRPPTGRPHAGGDRRRQERPAPAPEEIEAKKVKLAEARKEQTRLAGVVKTLEADERAAAIADEKTDLARGHHRTWRSGRNRRRTGAERDPREILERRWADQSTSRVFGAHDGVGHSHWSMAT